MLSALDVTMTMISMLSLHLERLYLEESIVCVAMVTQRDTMGILSTEWVVAIL